MTRSTLKTKLIVDLDEATQPHWLQAFRNHHATAFQQHGLPSKKNENWKYTDLSILKDKNIFAVTERRTSRSEENKIAQWVQQYREKYSAEFVLVIANGLFAEQFSTIAALPAGVKAISLAKGLADNEEVVKEAWPNHHSPINSPFACINAAVFTDGIFLAIPDNMQLNKPIHILNIASKEMSAIHTRNLIVLGKNSHAVIVQETVSLKADNTIVNEVNTIKCERDTLLHYSRIYSHPSSLIQFNHTLIDQDHASDVQYVNLLLGGDFVREDLIVNLNADHARCDLSGFYQSENNMRCLDNHVAVNHLAAGANSNMLYKGILAHDTRAIFNGRVYVNAKAQKTNAHQANHNLLLNDKAEIYSKPELEIYANDVKCKHGSTTGQMDEAALFYLRSRGIDLETAESILRYGFANEIVQRIPDKTTRSLLKQRLEYAESN